MSELHPEFYEIHPPARQDFTATTFPIFAIADGRVVSIDLDSVLIEYEGGHYARMFHVNDVTVVAGDKVVRGQQIGTGRG